MRMAGLLRAGVLSNSLKRCAGPQATRLFGVSPFQQDRLSMCQEICIHPGFRVTNPWHMSAGQLLMHGTPPFAQHQQCRWASGAAKKDMTPRKSWVAATTHATTTQKPVVYWGPLSDTLRKVKLLSLTSCCLSVITGPAITFLISPELSVILKGGIAASVIVLSASTTAALHWFLGPYVHKMRWVPGAKELEVETVTWMATYEQRTIQIEDIRPPKTKRPFVSFAVKDKFYFVNSEKIPNKELLRLVTFFRNEK